MYGKLQDVMVTSQETNDCVHVRVEVIYPYMKNIIEPQRP